MGKYEELRAAILRQAVIDYKEALQEQNYKQIASLERFFLGWWGQLLSGGHGEYIIERCKKEITQKKG